MKLPFAGDRYDKDHMNRLGAELEREDRRNRKIGTSIELVGAELLILRSPDGSRFKITVSNAGVLSAVAL